MRLLFATTLGHLPEMVGGMQTTTDQLACALLGRGVELAVLCTTRTPFAAAVATGYRTFRVADPTGALPAVAAGFRPDVVVVQSGPDLSRLLVAALGTALPVAVYLHNVEESELGGVLLPDPGILYVANSPFTAARWRAAFGLSCEVVPPCVEPARYLVDRTGDRILFTNPTVQKGVELFFRIAAARPGLGFTVVESWVLDPHWRRFCQERAARLGNVEWCAPSPDMRALYGRTRVLLMPSLWEEAYGRSVLEAQLSGIPALASTRGNLVETVGGGGLTVDPHAPLETWLRALEVLVEDRDGGFAAAARCHARRPDADPGRITDRFLMLMTGHARARPA
jgi:glycosyltransferase involved in cell wall biosynthesis